MKWITLCLFAISLNTGWSQPSKLTFGFEQDALPYLLNGYFANVWVGKGHVRSRLLLANVRKPDFLLPRNFTNNRVHAYAVTIDYFLKENWQGWWISGGGVLWNNSLQTDFKQQTAHFSTMLVNGSLGYSWKFYKNFYVSPWAGLHVRLNGDKSITIDSEKYTPPLFNPEASVKIGWHFR